LSFDTTNGTRGARQPTKMVRFINKLVMSRIRRKGGKIMGMNGLVLTTVGRKSGVERSTPVGWFAGENGSWLVVASAGGAANNPAWFFNIAAHPDKVQIEVDGRKVAVVAEQLDGADREKAWQAITATSPRFAGYQDKTDRKIPVIKLTAQASK
jgi:deazaflavin-dependent oxidoreductase (nitroreductase family)